MREIANYAANIKDRKVGNGDGWQYNFDGVVSEYAFCKQLNIFFDCSVEPRSDGYDCLHGQTRIDIKSTRYNNRGLLIPLKKKTQVDVFVCAFINENIVDFYGACSADMIYQEKNLRDFGYGMSYHIPKDKLGKIKS